jgi:hypothetical protein
LKEIMTFLAFIILGSTAAYIVASVVGGRDYE